MKEFNVLQIAALTMALTGFVSCQKDEPSGVEQGTEQMVELGFTAGLTDVDVELAETRATIEQASGLFNTGQKVGVFVFEDVAAWQTATSTYNGGKCIATTSAATGRLTIDSGTTYYWPYSGNNLKVYAWYPLTASGAITANMANSVTPIFTVAADQTSDMKANDLMYGVNEAAELEPGMINCDAKLTFSHKLMQVHVTLNAGQGLTASDLTGASITIGTAESSIKSSVRIDNLLTGVITVQDTRLGAPLQICSSYASGGTNSYAVIPPQDLNGLTLTVTMSNGGVLKASMGSNTFAANSILTINVTVKLTELILSSSIANWGVQASDAVKDGRAFIDGEEVNKLAQLRELILKGKDCRDYMGYWVDAEGNIDSEFFPETTKLKKTYTNPVGIIMYIAVGEEVVEINTDYKILVLGLNDVGATSFVYPMVDPVTISESGEGINGLYLTNQMIAKSSYFNAARLARNCTVSRPEGASEWFLPSAGQVTRMFLGYNSDNLTSERSVAVSKLASSEYCWGNTNSSYYWFTSTVCSYFQRTWYSNYNDYNKKRNPHYEMVTRYFGFQISKTYSGISSYLRTPDYAAWGASNVRSDDRVRPVFAY